METCGRGGEGRRSHSTSSPTVTQSRGGPSLRPSSEPGRLGPYPGLALGRLHGCLQWYWMGLLGALAVGTKGQ